MEYHNIYIKREEDDTKIMNMLIETVISYAMNRKDPYGIMAVNLNNMMTNLSAEIQQTTEGSKVKISLSSNFPIVHGASSSLLYQVFKNLLINALSYNDNFMPEINVSWSQTKEEYIFSVSDSVSDTKRRINLATNENIEQTGSITLCQKIVERMGEKIWSEFNPTVGNTVHFTIRKVKCKKQTNPNVYVSPTSEIHRKIA